ncbi:MAG: small subunit ribosomal protein [Candidatus Woesearchaeota archaeon]|nr:small subunit ribosomal protein [Candidatus Woesearchaeota archaeon]MDN5327728.1 small subunit ribosomal protein [Candidatus Woesearchaeota archaeon]
MSSQDFRQILRVANTDLDGNKSIYIGLRKIKGVSFSFANAICNILDLDKTRKVGTLTDEEVSAIEDILANPKKYNIPSWMLNLRNSPEEGVDKHLLNEDIKVYFNDRLKILRMIKSYRGLRLAKGLPVRGQRTKAHFRRSKKSLGVKRKK